MKKTKTINLETREGFEFQIIKRTLYGKLLDLICKNCSVPKYSFYADFSNSGVKISHVYLESKK